MISVILVQYNNAQLTRKAVETLKRHHPGGCELIIVDNASEGLEADWMNAGGGETRIRSDRNLGFGAANNLGAHAAHGEVLLFLNNDTITESPFLAQAEAEFAGDPSLGVLGPRLLDPDGSFQLSAGPLPSFFGEIRDKTVYGLMNRRNRFVQGAMEAKFGMRQDVGWVTGAALFVRASLFRTLDGFDENFFMFFEDKDLCLRARAGGYRVRYDPAFSLVHLKGGSSGGGLATFIRRTYRESQAYYYRKHLSVIDRTLLACYLTAIGERPHA